MNVFAAGRELVRWDVTALDPDGPYRLVIRHARGAIVEYFKVLDDALGREAELEALLVVAACHGRSAGRPTLVAEETGVNS